MQIFPRTLNYLPLVAAIAVAGGGALVTFVVTFYLGPRNLQVGYMPEQPVPYSHRLHAGELGIDCRYCHANVERSYEAMVPPTQTCMGCHAVVAPESGRLQPVRDSWESGEPVEWVRVHNIPDHAYFNHAAHLSAGVGCVSCHGRVDQMEVVRQVEPLSMGWCLNCHRNPEPNIRPLDRITDMDWELGAAESAEINEAEAEEVAFLAAHASPPEACTGCHR